MGDVKYNENFLEVSFLMLEYSRLCSINVILIFIKVLKYLASWFERVMIIFQTLSHAKSDILYFLIMYMIIFFAFVVMCHIYYGADLTTFGTIVMSLKTLFLMLLGDLGYLDDMIVLNKVLSFFFFIAFMTSMQFILVNMFIAFISNAYSEVKDNSVTAKRLEDELKQKHWSVYMEEVLKRAVKKIKKQKKDVEEEEDKAAKIDPEEEERRKKQMKFDQELDESFREARQREMEQRKK